MIIQASQEGSPGLVLRLMRPQQGSCMVGGGVIEGSGVWGGWDHPPLESELCSVGTVWSLPLPVHRQTHTQTHTHMDRRTYTCAHA